VLECYFNVGGQAVYHLGGLLEEARVHCDPALPWAETMMRFDPAAGRRHSLFISEWLPSRSPERRALDDGRSSKGS
jgi:hypothetical protein